MNYFDKIAEMDRDSVLHPFTYLKDYASGESGGPPVIVESGKGVWIVDSTVREYIDGFAGLYCFNVGYGRTEVAEAIARQAYKLAYYHSYASHTADVLATLSDRLVKMAPGKMSKVFYGLSGSDANETQAKIVWHCNNLRDCRKRKNHRPGAWLPRLLSGIGLDDRPQFLSRSHGFADCRHPAHWCTALLLGRCARRNRRSIQRAPSGRA